MADGTLKNRLAALIKERGLSQKEPDGRGDIPLPQGGQGAKGGDSPEHSQRA